MYFDPGTANAQQNPHLGRALDVAAGATGLCSARPARRQSATRLPDAFDLQLQEGRVLPRLPVLLLVPGLPAGRSAVRTGPVAIPAQVPPDALQLGCVIYVRRDLECLTGDRRIPRGKRSRARLLFGLAARRYGRIDHGEKPRDGRASRRQRGAGRLRAQHPTRARQDCGPEQRRADRNQEKPDHVVRDQRLSGQVATNRWNGASRSDDVTGPFNRGQCAASGYRESKLGKTARLGASRFRKD